MTKRLLSTKLADPDAVEVVRLGALAFLNALAAIAVFPLAPFIATSLVIPAQSTALTSTVFATMAGIGALGGAFLLSGVDQRRILTVATAGLGSGLLLSGLAPNLTLLLIARALTGICSGPLLAAVFAAVPGAVPEHRRNSALASVVGAYGLALVLGLPAVLLLALSPGGWRGAFFAVAGLCAILLVLSRPGKQVTHEGTTALEALPPSGVGVLLQQRRNQVGLALIASASFGTLLISPHLGTFAMRNAGLGDLGLWLTYISGGALAVASTKLTGWGMDRLGVIPTSVAMAASLTALLLFSFGLAPWQPPALMLGALLAAQLARSTVAQASAAQLVQPQDRLVYQCLVSTCTSLAQAAGSGCSTLILSEAGDGRLVGMPLLACLSAVAAWMVPCLLLLLRRLPGQSTPILLLKKSAQ